MFASRLIVRFASPTGRAVAHSGPSFGNDRLTQDDNLKSDEGG